MGKGENDDTKKAKAHPYMRPEQKTERDDHKNSENDLVGSIITESTIVKIPVTENGWEERFTWDTEKPYYYNTLNGNTQWERPEGLEELLFPHPKLKNNQFINDKDPLGLHNPVSDQRYRAYFESLSPSSAQKMWGTMSPENTSEQNRGHWNRIERSRAPSVGRFSNQAHFKDSDRKREQSTHAPVVRRFTSKDVHLHEKQANTKLMENRRPSPPRHHPPPPRYPSPPRQHRSPEPERYHNSRDYQHHDRPRHHSSNHRDRSEHDRRHDDRERHGHRGHHDDRRRHDDRERQEERDRKDRGRHEKRRRQDDRSRQEDRGSYDDFNDQGSSSRHHDRKSDSDHQRRHERPAGGHDRMQESHRQDDRHKVHDNRRDDRRDKYEDRGPTKENRRTPPKILPPRPKHLRSQDDQEDVSSSKKSKMKS